MLVLSTWVLASCGNNDDAEAKKLGFADKNEMYEVHRKGYHTKEKYIEMTNKEALRAKPLGEVTQ